MGKKHPKAILCLTYRSQFPTIICAKKTEYHKALESCYGNRGKLDQYSASLGRKAPSLTAEGAHFYGHVYGNPTTCPGSSASSTSPQGDTRHPNENSSQKYASQAHQVAHNCCRTWLPSSPHNAHATEMCESQVTSTKSKR